MKGMIRLIKILHYIPSFNIGGIESFIMNLYENIDKKKICFDFLVEKKIHKEYEELIANNGGKIFYIQFPKKRLKIFKYIKKINSVIKETEYDVFHCHVWNCRPFAIALAKINRIPIIITHAHACNFDTNSKRMFQTFFQKFGILLSNFNIACSDEAGKSVFKKKKYIVFSNAIDYNRFKYNYDNRIDKRKELKVKEDEILFINVGRFTYLKNQIFLIDIFNEIYKINNKVKLLLIGYGNDEQKIREKIKRYNLESNVVILNEVIHPESYLSASDYFIFPSISEGLGISLIEAQANGLKCIISNTIPSEAIIDNGVLINSLNNTAKDWADKIIKFIKKSDNDIRKCKYSQKFDVVFQARKYEKILEKSIFPKRCAIITLNGNNNFGNKLQNYALKNIIEDNGGMVETIIYKENKIKAGVKKIIRNFSIEKNEKNREKKFIEFNCNLTYSRKALPVDETKKIYDDRYDYVFYGSDQIWRPYNYGIPYLLGGNAFSRKKNISYAASFGISHIEEKYKENIKNTINNFNLISVRENRAKEIIIELTGRNDIEVLVDPTMLLDAEEWDKVSKKPEQIKEGEKYILNYFLGELSDSRKNEIERIAKENNCKIINIMDKKDPFYVSGPSEFLYLEKNAFLICTDSFHSSVFAILYNRPFIIFDREQEGLQSMNSRIDTLIDKFDLKNRRFSGLITKENLNHDYSEAYKILEKEREKSLNFLKKALDIKE